MKKTSFFRIFAGFFTSITFTILFFGCKNTLSPTNANSNNSVENHSFSQCLLQVSGVTCQGTWHSITYNSFHANDYTENSGNMAGWIHTSSAIRDPCDGSVKRDSALICFDSIYTPPTTLISPSHWSSKVYVDWGTTDKIITTLRIASEIDRFEPDFGFQSNRSDDLLLSNIPYKIGGKGEYIIDLSQSDLTSHVKYNNYFSVPIPGSNYPRSEIDSTSFDPFVITNPAIFSFKITLIP